MNHGDGSSGGDAASHLNPNQINATIIATRKSSDKGSALNSKGSQVIFKEVNNENNRVSALKPGSLDFFVISEKKLKMKLGIRRETATPEQRSKVSD